MEVKVFYILLPIVTILTVVFLADKIANAALKIPYPYSEYEPGQWISDTEQFFTYETLCTGYYIKDTSNKNKTKYVGFGDLDFKYTYEEDIPITNTSTSSSTN